MFPLQWNKLQNPKCIALFLKALQEITDMIWDLFVPAGFQTHKTWTTSVSKFKPMVQWSKWTINHRTVYSSSTIKDVSKHNKQLTKKSVNTQVMLSNVVISNSPQHTYTARQVRTATGIWPLMIGVFSFYRPLPAPELDSISLSSVNSYINRTQASHPANQISGQQRLIKHSKNNVVNDI